MRLGIKIITVALCSLLCAALSACGGGTLGTATRPPRTTMFEGSGGAGQLLRKETPSQAEDEPDQEKCKDKLNTEICPRTIE